MPRIFHGFEVKEKIGSGGMSTVYRGVHTTLGYPVAIKTLHHELAMDQAFVSRFEREAKAACSLKHNNIVSVIDFGSDDDIYFIVMEYIDGQDLAEIFEALQKEGAPPRPLPAEIALILLQEIAYGLKVAHDNSIIHRDIKPSNILIGKQGEVKITDFGLARETQSLTRKPMHDLTMPGMVVGTPSYMSPEQAAGSDKLDGRTDIFSLGVMAYQLLSGRKPFMGSTASEIQERIIKAVPTPLTLDTCPQLTPALITLVDRMLAKDPGKRFQNMDQVLRALTDSMESIDPANAAMKRQREYLSRLAQDPRQFVEELRHQTINNHLQRGYHYKNMGFESIGDAMVEFRRVLMLDPGNKKAAKAMEELESQCVAVGDEAAETAFGPEDADQTMILDQSGAAAGAPLAGPGAAPDPEEDEEESTAEIDTSEIDATALDRTGGPPSGPPARRPPTQPPVGQRSPKPAAAASSAALSGAASARPPTNARSGRPAAPSGVAPSGMAPSGAAPSAARRVPTPPPRKPAKAARGVQWPADKAGLGQLGGRRLAIIGLGVIILAAIVLLSLPKRPAPEMAAVAPGADSTALAPGAGGGPGVAAGGPGAAEEGQTAGIAGAAAVALADSAVHAPPPPPPTGRLRLQVEPAGAQIWLRQGRRVPFSPAGRAPLDTALAAGDWSIRVQGPAGEPGAAFADTTTSVRLRDGQPTDVKIVLAARRAEPHEDLGRSVSPATGDGAIELVLSHPCDVYVDAGAHPLAVGVTRHKLTLSAGEHVVELRAESIYGHWKGTVKVEPGAATSLSHAFATGSLRVSAQEERGGRQITGQGTLHIDGQQPRVVTLPCVVETIAAGQHSLGLSIEGRTVNGVYNVTRRTGETRYDLDRGSAPPRCEILVIEKRRLEVEFRCR